MKKQMKTTHREACQSKKKIMFTFMFLFFTVILMGNVSAFEFDNGIEYRNKGLTVDFENGHFFGIGGWFGLNQKIGEVTLKSHKSVNEVLEFGYGGEEVVMFYSFNEWELYEDGLGEVIFINEKNGRVIEKEYSFVKQVLKDFDVQDTEGNCTTLKNGTQECTYGVHTESFLVWEEFNGKNIPSGNTTIGLKTYINKGDYIDAVWTIAGKRLNKHALWTAADGQVVYWKLDELSGTLVDSQALINMTAVGSPSFGEPGILNTAIGMDSDFQGFDNTSSSDTSVIDFGTTGDYSVNFWINFTGNPGVFPTIFSTNNRTDPRWLFISGSGTPVITWRTTTTGAGVTLTTDGSLSLNEYHMITGVRNNSGTDYFLYIDSVLNQTLTGQALQDASANQVIFGPRLATHDANFTIDEFGIWNQTLEVDRIEELYNNGTACGFGDNFCESEITIILDSPADGTNFSSTTIVVMNATIFDTTNITNVTLYIDDVGNETNLTAGLNNTVWTFTKDMGQGDFVWTMEACNFANECVNATQRTFSVDTLNPELIIIAPETTVAFHEINTLLLINWSVNDPNLDTCILEYGGVNTTLTCLDNSTTINITTIADRTLTIYANDTFGGVNSTSRSWNYTIFQNSLTFNSESIGGNTEEFTLNVTKDSSISISTVSLIYNLSASPASFTLGDTSIISGSLDVPNPMVDSNFTFFFSFTMSDNQIINTTSNNQTVLNFAIGNCSTFSTLIYNFTLLDEENQTELSNVTIDYAFNLFDISRTTQITNFSESSNVNPTAICINQNLTDSSFSLDAVLQYVSTNGTYLTRFYNVLNFTLANSTIPNDINIYSVLDTTATPFQLTFRDSLLVLAPSILVNVNKQFVADNDFKTMEIPITDTNGQTVLNLVRNTAIYNLIFIDINGNIVASFNEINAFCQDFTIGECTLELDAASTVPVTFNLSESVGISGVIDYVNATSIATLTFNSINSTAVTVRLVGTTQNQFGNKSVCDSSLTTTLGAITCNASSILTTDNFLFLDIFSNGNYVSTTVIDVNPSNPDVGSVYGSNGYFMAFFMLLIIVMLFAEDKQALLIMLGIGWVGIIMLGLVKGSIIGAASGGIWLIVTIAIMLWKLKKEEVGR